MTLITAKNDNAVESTGSKIQCELECLNSQNRLVHSLKKREPAHPAIC